MKKVRYKPPSTSCICGKRGYVERRQARLVIREMKRIGDDPNSNELRVYRCVEGSGLWHVGHDNPAVNWPNLNDPRLRFLPGEIF